MVGKRIGVLAQRRQTHRQITRALRSAGNSVVSLAKPAEPFLPGISAPLDLLIVDCESTQRDLIEASLKNLKALGPIPPTIFLSVSEDNQHLLELFQRFEATNVIPKHGALRAAYPVLDERELLVTCEKVLRSDVFGIDKYIQSWGIILQEDTVTCMSDRYPVLDRFESFINELDCPKRIIPSMITVAEELITNAVVHAPCDASGQAKYENQTPRSTIQLEQTEYISVRYGCDGQRLMLSVLDRFGRLNKEALFRYVFRAMTPGSLQLDNKTSGAGIGLSLSIAHLHQMIFNIWDSVCTEVIAGWYIRVDSAMEFLRVGKSLNLFWLEKDSPPSFAA
jgi:hypothetical protein